MPVTEIVKKIDAYLASLRQARELLLSPVLEPHRKSSPLLQRRDKIENTAAPAASRPRANKVKTTAAALKTVRKAAKEHVAAKPVSRTANSGIHSEPKPTNPNSEPAKAAPAEVLPPPQVVKAEILAPAPRRGVRGIRPAARRTPKPAVHPKVEAVKPAIALAGSMHSKIVVVSAEEARRERDRPPVRPETKRPRLPSSGLSGRLAFEALFNDANDSSKNSER